MPRSVPEWVGKTDDTKVPPRVRERVFRRQQGICPYCNIPMWPGAIFQADHRIALINGGQNRENNLVVVHTNCHRLKTDRDVAEKAKVARVRQKHLGIKRNSKPMPGSKRSGWRKRMDGTVERRE